jgi:hypothetical protein
MMDQPPRVTGGGRGAAKSFRAGNPHYLRHREIADKAAGALTVSVEEGEVPAGKILVAVGRKP